MHQRSRGLCKKAKEVYARDKFSASASAHSMSITSLSELHGVDLRVLCLGVLDLLFANEFPEAAHLMTRLLHLMTRLLRTRLLTTRASTSLPERERKRKREKGRERERVPVHACAREREAGNGPALVIDAKVNGGKGDIAEITRLDTLVESTDPNLRGRVTIQH